MNRLILGVLVGVCLMVVVPVTFCSAAGKHYGELKMIEADIIFNIPVGYTVAHENGLTYYIDGWLPINDPSLVYPPSYWGTFPLYLPGTLVPAYLMISNLGPRAIAKHTLVTEGYVINLDGSNGAAIIAPQFQDIEVPLGETQVIATNIPLPVAAKGLNRVIVKLYHHENGENDASLVMQEEAIFCPPEVGVWNLVTENGVDVSSEAIQLTLAPTVYAFTDNNGCTANGTFTTADDTLTFTPTEAEWDCSPLSNPVQAEATATPTTLTLVFDDYGLLNTWVFVKD